MARYMNGSIRPSQSESISDTLRGVRSGYLMADGVPVTGDYVDAIRGELRGGFGPPPTPSVGFAATAEYVYPSKKMVTGAALAGQMLREALKTSYSSPADEYHRGLRSLRGLGAGDGSSASDYGYEPEITDTQRKPAVSPLAIRLAADFDLQAEVAEAIAAGAEGDEEKARDAAAKLVAGFQTDLAAYLKANSGAQYQYRACLQSEASDFSWGGLFGGFQPEKCSALVSGLAPGAGGGSSGGGTAFDWGKLGNELLALVGVGVKQFTQPAQTNSIDLALARLQREGKMAPLECAAPNQHTPACASALYALQTKPSSDNTGLYIGLGVAAVAVLGYFALSRKKSA
jgi:hypothetical protein